MSHSTYGRPDGRRSRVFETPEPDPRLALVHMERCMYHDILSTLAWGADYDVRTTGCTPAAHDTRTGPDSP